MSSKQRARKKEAALAPVQKEIHVFTAFLGRCEGRKIQVSSLTYSIPKPSGLIKPGFHEAFHEAGPPSPKLTLDLFQAMLSVL